MSNENRKSVASGQWPVVSSENHYPLSTIHYPPTIHYPLRPSSLATGHWPLTTHGFTLVELLVVITIIGVLISLLLPAVQAAREAARRMQCSNNFKQVGLAVHNYVSAVGSLPTGTIHKQTGRCGWTNSYYGFGWSVFILPYLEMPGVYDHFNFQVDYRTAPNSDIGAGATAIPAYICPSDPQTDTLVAATSSITHPGMDLNEDLGRTNIVGVTDSRNWTCDGYWIRKDGDGVFMTYNTIRLEDITDGTSNTLLVGEVTGDAPRSFNAHNWVIFTLADVGRGINGAYTIPGDGIPFVYRTGGDHGSGFSSYHSGGCNFGMADGSVQFLSQNIDQATLEALATRAKSETPTGTDF